MKTSKTAILGKDVKVTVTYECSMIDNIAYCDGDNSNLGKEMFEDYILTIDDNGKKLSFNGKIRVLNADNIFDAKKIESGAYAVINGQGFSKASAFKILTITKEAEAEAQKNEPEFMAAKSDKENKEKQAIVNEAKKVIEQAEREINHHGKLMTVTEYQNWAKQYNDIANEGGEGFIPTRITAEQYKYAKNIMGV